MPNICGPHCVTCNVLRATHMVCIVLHGVYMLYAMRCAGVCCVVFGHAASCVLCAMCCGSVCYVVLGFVGGVVMLVSALVLCCVTLCCGTPCFMKQKCNVMHSCN